MSKDTALASHLRHFCQEPAQHVKMMAELVSDEMRQPDGFCVVWR